jgi:hypothetical protein
VIGYWSQHTPSNQPELGLDFVQMNKLATSNSHINAKSVQEFRKTTSIRKQRPPQLVEQKPFNSETTFGVKNSPSTPMSLLISNTFQREAVVELSKVIEQKDASKPSNKLPGARHTRASIGHQKDLGIMEKEQFKMKRFQNVQGKVSQMLAPTKQV